MDHDLGDKVHQIDQFLEECKKIHERDDQIYEERKQCKVCRQNPRYRYEREVY